MIHRDIKPSNLLRADNGEVKIADLGVSDEFDGLDARLTATAGTPAFTPPECLNTGASGDFSGKAVDIWSLGVTLFCLVTGRLPFPGATVIEVYDKITREDPEVRRQLLIVNLFPTVMTVCSFLPSLIIVSLYSRDVQCPALLYRETVFSGVHILQLHITT